MNTVLTIAGSDCSGGAGIQADLKTMAAHNIYGMSAITALTAQNTTGVYGISECSPAFLEQQLDCIFTDIFPDAIKIGMVSRAELIEVITRKLIQYKAKNIVLDPVMISTSGSKLLAEDAMDSMIKGLAPLATVLTPNLYEAEVLSETPISSVASMECIAKDISIKCNAAVLIKGGHCAHNADDLLFSNGKFRWFPGEKIENKNTHGTGCTLSSAIACGLAKGLTLEESVKKAKEYISGAIKANINLGKGCGPLNHCWQSWQKEGERK